MTPNVQREDREGTEIRTFRQNQLQTRVNSAFQSAPDYVAGLAERYNQELDALEANYRSATTDQGRSAALESFDSKVNEIYDLKIANFELFARVLGGDAFPPTLSVAHEGGLEEQLVSWRLNESHIEKLREWANSFGNLKTDLSSSIVEGLDAVQRGTQPEQRISIADLSLEERAYLSFVFDAFNAEYSLLNLAPSGYDPNSSYFSGAKGVYSEADRESERVCGVLTQGTYETTLDADGNPLGMDHGRQRTRTTYGIIVKFPPWLYGETYSERNM